MFDMCYFLLHFLFTLQFDGIVTAVRIDLMKQN